jgi:hypothetical protein
MAAKTSSGNGRNVASEIAVGVVVGAVYVSAALDLVVRSP